MQWDLESCGKCHVNEDEMEVSDGNGEGGGGGRAEVEGRWNEERNRWNHQVNEEPLKQNSRYLPRRTMR